MRVYPERVILSLPTLGMGWGWLGVFRRRRRRRGGPKIENVKLVWDAKDCQPGSRTPAKTSVSSREYDSCPRGPILIKKTSKTDEKCRKKSPSLQKIQITQATGLEKEALGIAHQVACYKPFDSVVSNGHTA